MSGLTIINYKEANTMANIELITPQEWVENGVQDEVITAALQAVYGSVLIYERLDKLIDLVDVCSSSAHEDRRINNLKQQAEKFISIICNTDDVAKAMADRKNNRELWPTYLPNTSLRHLSPIEVQPGTTRTGLLLNRMFDHVQAIVKNKLLKVNDEDIKLDTVTGVKMLTDIEKEAYRILPANGLLWKIAEPSKDSARLSVNHFDTTDFSAHRGETGKAIFVLNSQGEMFASTSKMGEFHHSSFQKGGYVAYAGTLKADNGELKYIDDYSGHYTPKALQFFNMLKEFKLRNLIRPDTEIRKKYQENIDTLAIKMGSDISLLNTFGFLGMANTARKETVEKESVDHYQLLQGHFLNHFSEDKPEWVTFVIVRREYLKGEIDNDRTQSHVKDVNSLNNEIFKIEDDFCEKNPQEYSRHLQAIKKIIDEDSDLKHALVGSDWLPQAKIAPSI